jgi:hypothetical protein
LTEPFVVRVVTAPAVRQATSRNFYGRFTNAYPTLLQIVSKWARGVSASVERSRLGLALVGENRSMATRTYRLRSAEEPAAGMRRIARARAAAALDRLSRVGDEPAEAVHAARKDIKKLRALLRLVRRELGERRYRVENARYRDAARELSAARDAEVSLATVADLRKRYPEEMPAASTLERALDREHDRHASESADLREHVARAAESIALGMAEIEAWSLANDFSLVRDGLERSYRRGRRGLKDVRASPTDEAVHEWRKRVKDLWLQLRLVRGVWPAALDVAADQAHGLANLLGQHHDLAVLIAVARDAAPDDADAIAVEQLARRRQQELLAQALDLGDRLYAEKAARFVTRIEVYWRVWRSGR